MFREQRIFVFGTLMSPYRQKVILGEALPMIGVDMLAGCELGSYVDEEGVSYLKLVGNKDASVTGDLYSVSNAELEKLDRYEGPAYQRKELTLKSGITAWVYV